MGAQLAYATHDSPVGELLFVKKFVNNDSLRANHLGSLIRISYISDHNSAEDAFANNFGDDSPIIRDEELFDEEFTQFDQYFDGDRQHFDLRYEIDFPDRFQKEVLQQVATIPYGQTASYGEVAILAGSPNAYRAAGSACGHNPLTILIPCHRVIKADGTIGDYGSSGKAKKRFLLGLEASGSRAELPHVSTKLS